MGVDLWKILYPTAFPVHVRQNIQDLIESQGLAFAYPPGSVRADKETGIIQPSLYMNAEKARILLNLWT